MPQLTPSDRLLITGATGLVGSHVAEQAVSRNLQVRCLVRNGSDTTFLQQLGCELTVGALDQPESLTEAVRDVTCIVHCAAKVGDWGSTEDYRRTNVEGTAALVKAALASGTLKRWVQISSLGVYEAKDHYGTDESTPINTAGIDGYTLTKIESEKLILDAVAAKSLPAVVLRPGFIYGPRDRTVLPRLLERLQSGKFAYLGSPEKLMNNTWVGNLCEAVWLAAESEDLEGQTFNIRDPRLVSKREFVETICDAAGLTKPAKVVPLPVAKAIATGMETIWKLLGKKQAPLLNMARIKFLGLNLDFSIDRAGYQLGYDPATDFRTAMPSAVASLAEQGGTES